MALWGTVSLWQTVHRTKWVQTGPNASPTWTGDPQVLCYQIRWALLRLVRNEEPQAMGKQWCSQEILMVSSESPWNGRWKPRSIVHIYLDGLKGRMLLSQEKMCDAGPLVSRSAAAEISSISPGNSTWVKGYVLRSWPCHSLASCSCACLCAGSIPTLENTDQHNWSCRFDWEAAGWMIHQSKDKNIWASLLLSGWHNLDLPWLSAELAERHRAHLWASSKKRAAEGLHLKQQTSVWQENP